VHGPSTDRKRRAGNLRTLSETEAHNVLASVNKKRNEVRLAPRRVVHLWNQNLRQRLCGVAYSGVEGRACAARQTPTDRGARRVKRELSWRS
jgi:hypothetical protein